jgi:ribosomal protein L40E
MIGNMAQQAFSPVQQGIQQQPVQPQQPVSSGRFVQKSAASNSCGANCTSCGAQNTQGAKFCNECGAKLLTENVFCVNCGAEMPAIAKFCNECGTKRM